MFHDARHAVVDDPKAADSLLNGALDDVVQRLDDIVQRAGPARGPLEQLAMQRGKLLRPRLMLLASAIVAGEPVFCIELAAAAELIHAASLLHDDVIDEGEQRRGIPAARVVYGNAASVLAGDHCLTEAMDLVRVVDPTSLAEALACVRNLVDGELVQLATRGELVLDEAQYRRVCDLKTAALFVWSARAGARFAGACAAEINRFGELARELGIAFQIRDDLLDFVGAERFGKELHQDLREGRSTLPIILGAAEDPRVTAAIEVGDVETAARLVAASSALRRVRAEIATRIERARTRLASFPASAYRELLDAQIRILSALDG